MCNDVILGNITDREILFYNFLSDALFYVLLHGFCFLNFSLPVTVIRHIHIDMFVE